MRRIALACSIVSLLAGIPAWAESDQVTYREFESTVKRALAAYKLDDFEEAHRLGLKCAMLGDKDCQWLVGILYLKGTGVQQDGLEALKWMTVAVEAPHEERVTIYNDIMQQLPAETRTIVEQQGREYVELYGMRAQKVECARRAVTGGHIPELICSKQRWSGTLTD